MWNENLKYIYINKMPKYFFHLWDQNSQVIIQKPYIILNKTLFCLNKNIGRIFYSNKRPKLTKDNYNIKEIILKSNLQEHNLRNYLFRFFRETKFNSNYIYVLVKISFQYVLGIKSLGYKTIIKVDNQEDILNYVKAVCKYFNEHDESSHPEVGVSILINYIDTSETIYKRTFRNRKLNREIIKEIPTLQNIPWNTIYRSWGTYQIIDLNNSKITNVLFNKVIDYITLNRTNYKLAMFLILQRFSLLIYLIYINLFCSKYNF